MAPTIQKFLSLKGSVGLLSVLNERGKTYSEIESEVAITSDTISKRKDEALEIGLIEMKPARRNNRTVTEYHLTGLGEELVRQMSLMGIVSNYQSMRTHQRKVDAKTSELIDWVYQNPSQLLEFVESHEETLIDRTDADDEDDSSDSDEDQGEEESVRVIRPRSEDIQDADEDPEEQDPGPDDEGQRSLSEMEGDSVSNSETGEQEYSDGFVGDRSASEDREANEDESFDGIPEDDDEVPEHLQPSETWGEEEKDEQDEGTPDDEG